MRLVDSSAWVELLMDTDVGKSLRSSLPERDSWIVPTIVQLELAKWLARHADQQGAIDVLALTEKCFVVTLDSHLALAAASACQAHKLSTADGIIYATASAYDAELITCDAHFEGLPGVTYFANQKI